jgi:hypothetical protein
MPAVDRCLDASLRRREQESISEERGPARCKKRIKKHSSLTVGMSNKINSSLILYNTNINRMSQPHGCSFISLNLNSMKTVIYLFLT